MTMFCFSAQVEENITTTTLILSLGAGVRETSESQPGHMAWVEDQPVS